MLTEKRRGKMASNLNPRYAYTVVYVRDVAKSIAFYAKAFGYQVRRLDHSNSIVEKYESGETTIALTSAHQHKTDDLTGEVHLPQSSHERNPIEVCFDYSDVDFAYKNAIENGAIPISEPEEKEWGQKVGWGELESGETTIALTSAHQPETDDLSGEVRVPQSSHERNPIEVCFDYLDVDSAYKNAVENGAVPLSEPEEKEWRQKVGYVRDIDAIVVRMRSYVNSSKAHQ
ncbi:Hypothetical predicted protein [Olea europaea subsp. europaea]|uniref:VOC domain-containing protein n=1 Tax=Olea europaea subsp. europaea TaxID=158383 RepID=A0A8S0UHN7_OLEEU|nr:Hypothetical predicted protein [Olea europaea subsp. europaea]